MLERYDSSRTSTFDTDDGQRYVDAARAVGLTQSFAPVHVTRSHARAWQQPGEAIANVELGGVMARR